MKVYKATKNHKHFFKDDYVVIVSSVVVPTHHYYKKNNPAKSVRIIVDIFDGNRKKYNGLNHDLNPTDLKILMDCLEPTELKKKDLYGNGS